MLEVNTSGQCSYLFVSLQLIAHKAGTPCPSLEKLVAHKYVDLDLCIELRAAPKQLLKSEIILLCVYVCALNSLLIRCVHLILRSWTDHFSSISCH